MCGKQIARGTLALALVFCASAAMAKNLTVVVTGDSLTMQYWSYLPSAFDQMGIEADVPNPVYNAANSINTARSSMTSPLYAGQYAWPGTRENPINYANNVLAADPDAIFFMLGINDLWSGTLADNDNPNSAASKAFGYYKYYINQVFNQFANFANSSGMRPDVYIASILPFDLQKNQAYWNTTNNSGALERIENWYNPWLSEQSSLRNFTYVDLWSAIQQNPNWKTDYMAAHDGLHLSSQGSQWVAMQFAMAVPEPDSLLLLGFALGAFALWRKFACR